MTKEGEEHVFTMQEGFKFKKPAHIYVNTPYILHRCLYANIHVYCAVVHICVRAYLLKNPHYTVSYVL